MTRMTGLSLASHFTSPQLGNTNKKKPPQVAKMQGVRRPGMAPPGGLAGAVLPGPSANALGVGVQQYTMGVGANAPPPGVTQPATPSAPPYQRPPMGINPSDGTPMPLQQVPKSWGMAGSTPQQAMQPVNPNPQWNGPGAQTPPTPVASPPMGAVGNPLSTSPELSAIQVINAQQQAYLDSQTKQTPQLGPLGQQTDYMGPPRGGNDALYWDEAQRRQHERAAAMPNPQDTLLADAKREYQASTLLPGTQFDQPSMNMSGRPNRWVTRGGNVDQPGAAQPGPAPGTMIPMSENDRAHRAKMMQDINETAQRDQNPGDYRYRPLTSVTGPDGSAMGPDGTPIPPTVGQSRYDIAKQRRQDYLRGEGDFTPKEGEIGAYAERQAALGLRKTAVQDNAEAEAKARRARLDSRSQGGNPEMWAMMQNPRLALEMMKLKQEGQMGMAELRQKGDFYKGSLGLQQQQATTAGNLAESTMKYQQDTAKANADYNSKKLDLEKQLGSDATDAQKASAAAALEQAKMQYEEKKQLIDNQYKLDAKASEYGMDPKQQAAAQLNANPDLQTQNPALYDYLTRQANPGFQDDASGGTNVPYGETPAIAQTLSSPQSPVTQSLIGRYGFAHDNGAIDSSTLNSNVVSQKMVTAGKKGVVPTDAELNVLLPLLRNEAPRPQGIGIPDTTYPLRQGLYDSITQPHTDGTMLSRSEMNERARKFITYSQARNRRRLPEPVVNGYKLKHTLAGFLNSSHWSWEKQ